MITIREALPPLVLEPEEGRPARASALDILMAARPRLPGAEYLIAAASVAGVAAVRALLAPLLSASSPFLIFVLPTVFMAMRSSTGPALFAGALSAVFGVGLFIQPSDLYWWADTAQSTRLGLFVAVTLLIAGLGSMRQRAAARALEAERLRVVQLTMRTVEDIVINSVTEMQALRVEVENTAPRSAIEGFDRSVQTLAVRLRDLAHVPVFKEKQMSIGPGLDEHPG